MLAIVIGIEMCHMQNARVSGRKFFHNKCISWSYRNRGYDARIHKNMVVKINVLSMKLSVNSSGLCGLYTAPRKMIVDRAFIMMMLVYSAMKNSANGPAAYSTLKPDTSSDSPSVRSNGARFVSASVEINHMKANGHAGSRNQVSSCDEITDNSEKDPDSRRMDRRIMASVTSYEIVWATARRAPISAYLEFEAQPDHRIEYTDRLEVARMNRAPRFRLSRG